MSLYLWLDLVLRFLLSSNLQLLKSSPWLKHFNNVRPAITISKILNDISSLISDPKPDDASCKGNYEADELHKYDRCNFEAIAKAKEWTKKYSC